MKRIIVRTASMFLVMLFAFLLPSCADIFLPPKNAKAGVKITIGDKEINEDERTVNPSNPLGIIKKYTLTFEGPEGASLASMDAEPGMPKYVQFPYGEWTVTAKGYADGITEPVASGTYIGTISEGVTEIKILISMLLHETDDAITGTFKLETDVTAVIVDIWKYSEKDDPGKKISIADTQLQGYILPSGYYWMEVSAGGEIIDIDVVYIYPGTETVWDIRGGSGGQYRMTITGIESETGDVFIRLYENGSDVVDDDPLAEGQGSIVDNEVMFTLKNSVNLNTNFTESGDYVITLSFPDTGYTYVYTRGETLIELEISSITDYSKLPRYYVTDEVSIGFDKFVVLPEYTPLQEPRIIAAVPAGEDIFNLYWYLDSTPGHTEAVSMTVSGGTDTIDPLQKGNWGTGTGTEADPYITTVTLSGIDAAEPLTLRVYDRSNRYFDVTEDPAEVTGLPVYVSGNVDPADDGILINAPANLARVFSNVLARYSDIKIIVSGDISIGASDINAEGYTVNAEKTIVMEPFGGNREISRGEAGCLFTIDGSLTIQGNTVSGDLTFRGNVGNNRPLMTVSQGTLIMNSGAVITGNNNTNDSNTANDGGGVRVNDGGKLIMYGGKIRSGNYSRYGGGVYVAADGSFTMEGGEISGNSAVYGGGVFINTNGNFKMTSGSIAQNTVSLAGGGGGVYINGGSFEMSGGIIGTTEGDVNDSDNKGNIAGNGGGVYNGGTFTMTGGAISGNKALSGQGGGVWSSGKFTMTDGTISGNTAAAVNAGAKGGGVYIDGTVNSSEFTKSGGVIYGIDAVDEADRNTAENGEGHAVYVSGTNPKGVNNTVSNDNDLEYDSGTFGDGWGFTVTFNSNGGTPEPAPVSVDYGGKISQPAAMNKTGYTFGGWYEDAALTNAWDFDNDAVSGDTTLYAKWTINSYTVTFNADGGAGIPASMSVTHGSTLEDEMPIPAKDGYFFGGWFTDNGFTNEFTAATPVTADITLYAKWTQPQIEIRQDSNNIALSGEYDFGEVSKTAPKEIEFTIVNNDGEELVFTAVDGNIVNVSPDTAGFEVTNQPSADTSIAPGDATTFKIKFTPSAPTIDKVSSQVSIQINSQYNAVLSFSVTGTRYYAIGETGPAGGLVFYDAKGTEFENSNWRYLEAAPADKEFQKVQWGAYGDNSEIGTQTGIGTGKANTQKIVDYLKDKGEVGRAAQLCDELNVGGYDDWFLPSLDELNEMYKNLWQNNTDNPGGFQNVDYWSSSQGSDAYSYRKSFDNTGSQNDGSRNFEYNVRAIRAF